MSLVLHSDLTEKKTDRLARNLSYLMTRQRVKESDLARALNLPYVTIHRLVTGETTDPRLSTLQQLARYFSITLDELIGEKLPLNASEELFQIRKVPLLNWEIIADPEWKTHIEWNTWENWEPIALRHKEQLSLNAYALKTRHGMQPRFPLGTLLVIDPNVQAKDGDLIIVRLRADNAVSLRRLLVDPPSYQLESLTENIPNLEYNSQKHHLIGVVVLTLFYNTN